MLVMVKLEPHAETVLFGTVEDLDRELFRQALSKINLEEFQDAKLVVKGCGEESVPDFAYVEITRLLRPVVFSLFYGEPCSTVPLYKKKVVK